MAPNRVNAESKNTTVVVLTYKIIDVLRAIPNQAVPLRSNAVKNSSMSCTQLVYTAEKDADALTLPVYSFSFPSFWQSANHLSKLSVEQCSMSLIEVSLSSSLANSFPLRLLPTRERTKSAALSPYFCRSAAFLQERMHDLNVSRP